MNISFHLASSLMSSTPLFPPHQKAGRNSLITYYFSELPFYSRTNLLPLYGLPVLPVLLFIRTFGIIRLLYYTWVLRLLKWQFRNLSQRFWSKNKLGLANPIENSDTSAFLGWIIMLLTDLCEKQNSVRFLGHPYPYWGVYGHFQFFKMW